MTAKGTRKTPPAGGRHGARAAAHAAPAAPAEAAEERSLARRVLVRGPWEWVATVLIAVGIVMLMQPVSLWLYSWSFAVILTGTVMFLVVSHFPEGD